MPTATEYQLLSNSKVKCWRRCPYQFRYRYILGYKSKEKSIYLERGTWLHALLECHFEGGDWKKKHKQLQEEFNALFEEERVELGDLPQECYRIMQAYLWNYSDADRGVKVVDTELDEIITLPNGLRFRMIIDKIIEEPDGGLWIVDYKTVGRFLPSDFLLLDSQLARYFWGAEYMGYKPLRGIMYDEILTKAPTKPELLKNGQLTKRANLNSDLYTYYREIKKHGLEIKDYKDILIRLREQNDRWFRRTRLPKDPPLTKRLMDELTMSAREIKHAEETDSFPRSPMKDCQWDCSFIGPCTISLQGGDPEPLLKMKFDKKERTTA